MYEYHFEDPTPNWDWKSLGFEDELEFKQWVYFQRESNPNYTGDLDSPFNLS